MHDTRIRPELHTLMPGKPGSVVGSLLVAIAGWNDRDSVADRVEPRIDSPPRPELERLKATVTKLASPEMEGRRGEGARKAAAFLIDEFRRLKLEPLFQGQFVQEVPAADDPGRVQGRNVGAVLRGSRPVLTRRVDHRLGTLRSPGRAGRGSLPRRRRQRVGRGDDARGGPIDGRRRRSSPPQRDVHRLRSRGDRPVRLALLRRPPAGAARTNRAVHHGRHDRPGPRRGLRQPRLRAGNRACPGSAPWIDRAARDRPLTVGLLGSDLLVLNRSDYGPFRSRQIPYLFFSTGENPRYHSPRTTAGNPRLPQAGGDQPGDPRGDAGQPPALRPYPAGPPCPTTRWPRP